jgi:multidrug efflux system outer membrane protein
VSRPHPWAAFVAPGVALALAACAVGPRYRAPDQASVAIPDGEAAAKIVSAASYDPAWWSTFNDPVLDKLMARGLAGNLDLRIAAGRVSEARALFSDSRLDLFPRVTAGGGYTRSDQQIPGSAPGRVNVTSAELGFDARWEIDLFGRVRHQVDAARAESQATAEDLRSAKITVAAEIARNYLALRGAQAQRAVAEHNAGTARQTLKLTLLRQQAGRGDLIDVESAGARLDATQALIPALSRRETQSINRLAVLVGARPGMLDIDLGAV